MEDSEKTSVLVCSHGTSVYDLLNIIIGNDEKFSMIENWYCFGNSCLIVLMKHLGYTHREIFNEISDPSFDFMDSLIPGFSISERKQQDAKNMLLNLIESIVKKSKMFTGGRKVSTFQSLFEKTGFNLNISTWCSSSSSSGKHTFINKDNFSGSIWEALVIGLCSSSYVRSFELKETDYSSSSSIVHPLSIKLNDCYFVIPKYSLEYYRAPVEEQNIFYKTEIYMMKEFINFIRYGNESFKGREDTTKGEEDVSYKTKEEMTKGREVIFYSSELKKSKMTLKMKNITCSRLLEEK